MTKHNHIAHWSVVPLKRFLHIQGSAGSNSDKQVGLENIESWTGRHVETGSSFDGAGTAFQPQDILFGKLRPYLAKAMIAREAGSAVGDLWVLRPGEDCIPEFALYQLLDPTMIDEINSSTTGAKMPRAEWQTVGALKRPFPTRSMQKEIVAYLDGETHRIDDLIAEKNSFITLLREKRVAAISHAVTKGIDKSAPMKPSGQDWLGDVPAHWDTVRLGMIFREAGRKGDLDRPVLSVSIHAGVSDEEIANEDRDRKVALSEDRSKYQGVMPGDLVYNMMRAWQGAFGAVATEGLVSPAYVVARPVSDARTKFIELQLRTPQAIEEMRRYSKGIADFRMRLYWEHFRNVAVALPPLDEQDAILKYIDRETNRIDSLIHETKRSIALLKEKRKTLITAAVNGKIDVRSAA